MHKWCNCEGCIDEWKARNAYWETDEQEAPYKPRKKKPKTPKSGIKPCKHVYVWVEYVRPYVRTEKNSIFDRFPWAQTFVIPGKFYSIYKEICLDCDDVRNSYDPRIQEKRRYRSWRERKQRKPYDYEIYQTYHCDKNGRVLD